MLGINFDYKLKFTDLIDEICNKASQKLNAFARIALYMSIQKRRTLMNAFLKSQFNYCPLIWMCCDRSLNNKIDRLHERSYRIVYSDKHQISEFKRAIQKSRLCKQYVYGIVFFNTIFCFINNIFLQY